MPSLRSIIRWASASSVLVHVPARIGMKGFRFLGQHVNYTVLPPDACFPIPSASPATVTFPSQLGAETAAHADNWYAVFGCANAGGLSYRIMPFLRVGSIAGSVCTLTLAGMVSPHSSSAATYSWVSNNNLAGVDCLVITEQVNGRNNAFSGRLTWITANNATTVTLATIGNVGLGAIPFVK